MAPADVEGLRAENARLTAEMTSMKKKMMLAMKKQSSEVKLAQQRAEAAEAALAAASSGSPSAVDSHSGNEGSARTSFESRSPLTLDTSAEQDEVGGDSGDADGEALGSDALREHDRELEKENFEKELMAMREKFALEAQKSAEEREKLEEELRAMQSKWEQATEQLVEQNRLLESQQEEMSKIRVEMDHMSDTVLQNNEQLSTDGLDGVTGHETKDGLSVAPLQQQLLQATSKIHSLEAELQEQADRLKAAEAAMMEATRSQAMAEEKLADLLPKLEQASGKLEEETSSRDVKYAELDAKFGRLLKRSKQRIQEVQKEKEDMEEQFKAGEEKCTQALARQAALQADLDATRNQAGEAIRTLDSERQQLTNSLRRAKQDIEDLRQMLEAKEHELNESFHAISEKEQKLLEMASLLKEAEESQETAMIGLKETHQKVIEDYELQLAEAAKDRNKGDESLSALQSQLAAKESRLAEVEAASSGELVRLGALLEAARGDNQRLQSEFEKERGGHQSAVATLLAKLEASEVLLHDLEMSAASNRSKLESELEGSRQALSAVQEELATARAETKAQSQELAAYKVRAHALLQKKEAALQAAQDSTTMAVLESAVQEAKAEAAAAIASRESVMKKLEVAKAEYKSRLDTQAGALEDADHHIRDLAAQLESSKTLLRSQQVDYERRLVRAEELRRSEASIVDSQPQDTEQAAELAALRLAQEQLRGEFESYKEMTNSMMTSKDEEIMRILDEKASLQKLFLQKKVDVDAVDRSVNNSPPPLAEQQILSLARLQAQREEEVSQCKRHIEALQDEIKELEHENRVRIHQITILKEEFHNSERNQKRSHVDMTYVKNVILKLLETGEVEALLPVIAMLLQFSPDELRRCQDMYKMQAGAEVPLSGAAAVVDAATAAPRSLLSRFSLS